MVIGEKQGLERGTFDVGNSFGGICYWFAKNVVCFRDAVSVVAQFSAARYHHFKQVSRVRSIFLSTIMSMYVARLVEIRRC